MRNPCSCRSSRRSGFGEPDQNLGDHTPSSDKTAVWFRSEPRLLAEQLRVALAEVTTRWRTRSARREASDAFEVAILAGLLARYGERLPELRAAERWRVSADGERLLNRAVSDLVNLGLLREITDSVLHVEVTDEPEERSDALLALDEVCAGLYWLDAKFAINDEIDLVTRTIETFPEPWRDLAAFASAALTGSAPPRRDDPAWRVWAVVEATRWEEPLDVPAEFPDAEWSNRVRRRILTGE